jgi:N-acetylglucosaminyl-diphospho-decaprenol L-rhamnosyltransferase
MEKPAFSISIVSHGHRELVRTLLSDLSRLPRQDFEIVLTWNLAEESATWLPPVQCRLIILCNRVPKGFAENHNAAFRISSGENFVILNPDIRILCDPFDKMLEVISTQVDCVCAPIILNPDYEQEDSARWFPSPYTLFKKLTAKLLRRKRPLDCVPQYGDLLQPDWVAGMFIVVPRRIYHLLQGLDERYFLYYEDVDFCARAQCIGIRIFVSKCAPVIHDARRSSHREIRYLTWHVHSALMFFVSRTYWTVLIKRLRRTWHLR